MATRPPDEAARELLERDGDVRDAVASVGGRGHAGGTAPATTSRDRVVAAAAALGGAAALGLRAVLGLPHFAGLAAAYPILPRLATAIALVSITILLERVFEVVVIGRVRDAVARFDLERVARLLAGLVAAGLMFTTLVSDWRSALASLGLVSLVLGFALQTPITSLIAWVYILAKRPFRIGDRIRMGDVTGDVIDIGYLDTTLWEFGGEYLSTDHPSGRLIKFPNLSVLQSPVWNYSWPAFPFVWNEIKVQVGYDSDLDLVTRTMQQVVQDDIGGLMAENVRTYREILARTPVDHLDVKEVPTVVVRVADSTWVEVIVRYLVHPKESGRVRSRMLLAILAKLGAEPDRVRFPKGDMR